MVRLLPKPLSVLFVALLFVIPLSVRAQIDADIRIWPIDRAVFLAGQMFDFQIELIGQDALPDDFAVTINGQDAATFFGGEAAVESWAAGDDTVTAATWAGLALLAPGEYVVEVTASGDTQIATWTVREALPGEAQNVILFIADGGSSAVYTAARLISRGMDAGLYNDGLVFDGFSEIGLLHTSGIDSIITDSANSASAYNTGHKTAVNATGSYPNTSPNPNDDPRVETFAEMIKRTRDMSVGVVSTSDITDATPAAVWGHARRRDGITRSNFANAVLDEGINIDVLLGGGGQYFLPGDTEGSRRVVFDPETNGSLTDTRDVFAEYEDAGYTVVTTNAEMQAALDANAELLLGIFNISDMSVWLDRNVYTDNASRFPDQPGLVDMTLAALEILNQNENGFYLMVEAASVDKALHPMDFERALADTIEFERSIAAAYEWTQQNAPDTLIIVTSDHAHSFDVWGTVNTTAFNAATDDAGRRNAVGVYQAAGFPTYTDADGDYFPDDWDTEITLAMGKADFPDFTEDYQVSEVYRTPASRNDAGVYVDNADDDPTGILITGNLPTNSSTSVHTLQDIPVFAEGPGAECLGRVSDNIEIFYCMAAAIGLDLTAEDGTLRPRVEETTVEEPVEEPEPEIIVVTATPDPNAPELEPETIEVEVIVTATPNPDAVEAPAQGGNTGTLVLVGIIALLIGGAAGFFASRQMAQ